MNDLAFADQDISQEVCGPVAFVGQTLGPLFAEDPLMGSAKAVYDEIMALDVDSAGADWPFVDDEKARRALHAMKNSLIEEGMESVAWEYRRLFVGPAPKVTPPWGSVYTDHDGVMFGDATLALRIWVRENQVPRATDGRTPEDHVGLMLEQMGWIALNRPDLLKEYLRDHLLTWSGHFLGLVAQRTESDFYRGLAELTDESLEGIRRELKIVVAVPRFYR